MKSPSKIFLRRKQCLLKVRREKTTGGNLRQKNLETHFLRFVFLSIFWIVLSGWDHFLTLKTLVVIILCGSFSWVLLKSFPPQKIGKLRFFPLFSYVLMLVGKIVLSGLQVAIMALRYRRNKTLPLFVPLYVKHKTDHGRLTHAYAITLTPGTFVIDVYTDGFLLHALDASFVVPGALKEDAKIILTMENVE